MKNLTNPVKKLSKKTDFDFFMKNLLKPKHKIREENQKIEDQKKIL